jgi:glycerol-3-phosphate dehydrogenase
VAALTGQVSDVLVIGGGIVGAGIARDAALRGLQTGLIEQRDFAFGSSSRSSRLLHGGLRYLAQGRVGLVREASVEKMVLRRIAPHLVEPLAFIFPAYRGTDWPLWQLRIGVKFYDLLCGDNNFGVSGSLTRAEALRRLPALKPERLAGAVRYFDALTNDARLAIDTLRSAAAHGAAVLNYCGFTTARREGSLWRAEALDHLSGHPCQFQARAIVNATGPWADRLPQSGVRLRLTKGIHCVFDRARLPVPEAVVITEGQRILFLIPWGRRMIVGTTDTDYHGSLEDVRAEPEDLAYVLRSVNEFFPGMAMTEADVLATWAGLRPLIAKASDAPSDLSRSHQIRTPIPGWWDVAGGKLTTYRLMAEQTVDRVLRYLRRSAPCCTDKVPLLAPEAIAGFSGITPPAVSSTVIGRYCEEEWAVHPEDVMLRRAGWAYSEANPVGVVRLVAACMGEVLGWTPAQQAAELARFG